MKKCISFLLALVMLLGCMITMTGCGGGSESDTSFTYLLNQNEDSSYYTNYGQNPAMLYLLNQEYNGKKLEFDFKTMVSGSETDQFNIMISTGEYYDIMSMAYSGYSAEALYEMGIALDLTELVNQYMPNYIKFLDEHPDVARVAYTMVDGEKKIYQLYSAKYEPVDNFQGFCYRRDWIAKYGADVNGNAFTYSYDENGILQDNIIFPSWYMDTDMVNTYKSNHPDWDGTDPVFLSDWEWMFEIFDKAKQALGFEYYNISCYYMGFMETGDLYSSFGGGAPMWSYNQEKDTVEFNATSTNMQAYLECLNSWYEKGWLDPEFNQRSTDMFYSIDLANVRSGKVGMWKGQTSDLGSQIKDVENYPYTDGIYVWGAKPPINDIYGGAENQGVEPNAMYQYERPAGSIIITDKAAEKDLVTLLTFLDSLCEGDSPNNIAKVIGLTQEQYASIRDQQEEVGGQAFQERFGLEAGNYTVQTDENGANTYILVDTLLQDSKLKNASIANLFFGMSMKSPRITYSPEYYHSVRECWDYYMNTAYISASIQSMLSEDLSKDYSKIHNNVNTKMSTEIPKFIMGEYDIYGEDWNDFVKAINRFQPEAGCEIFNQLYENLA